jgi:hypothetical protein
MSVAVPAAARSDQCGVKNAGHAARTSSARPARGCGAGPARPQKSLPLSLATKGTQVLTAGIAFHCTAAADRFPPLDSEGVQLCRICRVDCPLNFGDAACREHPERRRWSGDGDFASNGCGAHRRRSRGVRNRFYLLCVVDARHRDGERWIARRGSHPFSFGNDRSGPGRSSQGHRWIALPRG